MKELLQLLSNSPRDESIYLLRKLSESCGFFAQNGQLYFVAKNHEQLASQSFSTDRLMLATNIYIRAVANTSQFGSGNYNIIKFRGNLEERLVDTFLRVCLVYSHDENELSFTDFFHSLASIFVPSQEQIFKNLVGAWGELVFLRECVKVAGVDLSNNWHQQGSYAKYDITLDWGNLEVKTVVSPEPIVKLKHDQLFNGDQNYLVVCCLQNDDYGESLEEVVASIRSMQPKHFGGINFAIRLEKEMGRISPVEARTKRFKLFSLSVHSVRKMQCIQEIPECISELSYTYSLEESSSEDLAALLNRHPTSAQ